ncbi:MAG: hypothetical protein VX589_10215 [Myxococcota bacterium]|nr:hypothetical protein [Myxococcota bacterium]
MRALSCTLLVLIAHLGCSTLDESVQSGPHSLDNLKTRDLDYVSTNAREYTITGVAQVRLAQFDRLETDGDVSVTSRFEAAVAHKLNRIDNAVKRAVDEVVKANNGGDTGKDASYFTYFRRGASSSSDGLIVIDATTAEFTYHIQLVGSYYLMSILSPDNGRRRMLNITLPARRDAPTEVLQAEIKGSEARDAFPRYDALFADGVLDFGIHFGGDYNKERYDLETAKWFVTALLDGGWTNAGVSRFDDLTIDSAPFVKTVLVEGQNIRIEVHVYHADMVPHGSESRLSDAMKTSLAQRDIVMYSGHAGPRAGFILDYDRRHEIKAEAFTQLALADKYQIYILDGCQTYRTYVHDLLKNPAKTFDNLDIVTTVNTTPFSAGFQVLHEFMYWLTITNADGRHFPLSWKTILRGVNTRRFRDVHYGVHGIANNPQLNPHGSTDIMCRPCATDTECGGGGNLCLDYQLSGGCGVACTTDTACPDGYRCRRLVDDPSYFYLPKQCVRRDYTCP